MYELISVIVPVYNVERYLEKCVDSIINQTYSNLEIILVNDGSTDNSGELCDNLAKKDSRIVVYHKENGGVSSARNLGLDKAQGDYIGFVDGDDYIDADMYECLYQNLNRDNADMSMCALYDVYVNTKLEQVTKIENYVVNSEQAIKIALEGTIPLVSPTSKLYKAILFEELRYEEGKTYEDAFIIARLLDKCNIITITNEKKYYYFHRSDSITTKPFSIGMLDVIEAWKYNLSFISQCYPSLINSAYRRLYWAYFYVLDSLMSPNSNFDNNIYNMLTSVLKKNMKFILFNPYFNLKRKFMLLSLYIHPIFYKFAVKKFKNKVN